MRDGAARGGRRRHDVRIASVAGSALLVLGLATAAWAQVPEAEIRFNQGLTHLREGRLDMALEDIKKAIKQDGKNPYFYKGLGVAYMQMKKYPEAISALRRSLELNPYYVDVHNDLGTAYVLAGKREEGKKEFLKAFNEPTNPTPELSARNLGQAFYEERSYDEALKWFQTSVKRNIKYTDAQLGLADSLVAMGRIDEATVQLESASSTLPDDPAIALALGEAYYKAGRFAEARTKLEQAARSDPGGPAGRRAADVLKSFPK